MPNGIATSFATPNFDGALYLHGRDGAPLLSLLQKKRSYTNAVKFTLGQEYKLAEPKAHQISEIASLTAPEPTFNAPRKAGFNVTQIFQKTYGISDAKRSNMGTMAPGHILVAGMQPTPRNELTFQTDIAMRELARDIEWTFINGRFNEATDDDEANQTRGLNEAITTNVMDMADNEISYWDLFDLLRAMRLQGANTQGLVLWSDPIVRAQLMVEAAEDMSCKIVDGTSMGLNITTLYTPAGSIVIHEGEFLPPGTAFLLNLGMLGIKEQYVEGKGNFYRELLAKTGAGEQWMIFGQAGLDYGMEWAHAKITNVSANYHRPRGKKVFMASAVETAEISPVINGVTLSAPPVVGEATAELAIDWTGEPVNPTLKYQWQVANSAIGAFTDIEGATGATYTPTEDEVGMYIRVVVTATGTATGTTHSNAKKVTASA